LIHHTKSGALSSMPLNWICAGELQNPTGAKGARKKFEAAGGKREKKAAAEAAALNL
jgi:hypothetical protein